MNTCKNCEKPFEDDFSYCPFCGQEAADKLTFGVLFSNTISNYFSVDARFFRSFLPLMTKPGILARRFIDGKRLSYLHPAQFYLFISVVFFFIFSFSVRKADHEMTEGLKKGFEMDLVPDSLAAVEDSLQLADIKENVSEQLTESGISDEEVAELDSIIPENNNAAELSFDFDREVLDSLIAINAPLEEQLQAIGMDEDAGLLTRKYYTQMLKFYKNKGAGVLKALYDTIPIAMFFMLPLFAFLVKLFFWKKGIFAHHMVFSFYFFTFLFASFSLLLILGMIWEIPWWIDLLFFLSFFAYLVIAIHNFYRSRWLGSFFKAGFISFIYLLMIVPIAFIGVMFVSILIY
ncbi:MAG: DUF3667 domain-containing protein [Flavobacteriales bacterium]|nr:DUF3667 domain-containing protein [Flavobacteriales bacterium]